MMDNPEARARVLLRAMFDAVVRRAQPIDFLAGYLPEPPKGRTIVVGAGKAAATMAVAFETLWPDKRDGAISGVVATRYGYAAATRVIRVIEAGHPVPDQHSLGAAEAVIAAVQQAGPDDLVICLMSGGGSAVLCKPALGLSLQDKQQVHRVLLESGASIAGMNLIRRRLSAIKGGRLPLAAPNTPIVALLMSDVPGDDPAVIASGPTVPDLATLAEARAVADAYGMDLPPSALEALKRPENEVIRPGDSRLAHVENRIVMTPRRAIETALPIARDAGYETDYLGADLEGDAAALGREHARLALTMAAEGKRCCIVSGGETTVRVTAKTGRGGRNTQYLLSLAIGLADCPGVYAMAADTDGIDGTEDNAGAFIGPHFLESLRGRHMNPEAYLSGNNAYTVFEATGDLLITGPTGTNVNDLRIILIEPDATV